MKKMLDDPMWQKKEQPLLHSSLRDNLLPGASIFVSHHALGQEIPVSSAYAH